MTEQSILNFEMVEEEVLSQKEQELQVLLQAELKKENEKKANLEKLLVNKPSMEQEINNVNNVNNVVHTPTITNTVLTPEDFDRAAKAVKNKYIYMDDFCELMELGIKLKKPVMIYGKGGHSKSEASELYLRTLLNRDVYVKSCGAKTTSEDLFGPISSKEYKEKDIYVHNVAGTWLEQEFVIFEELLDAPIHVLLDLKDVITSGKFRNGTQNVINQNKFILCLTNRSKSEVMEDDSIQAFLDRFPLTYKMEWDRYNKTDFKKLFKKVLSDELTDIAELIENLHDTGIWVSPRTAIHIGQIYLHSNYSGLKFIEGITAETLKKIKQLQIQKEAEKDILKVSTMLDTFISNQESRKSDLLLKTTTEEISNEVQAITLEITKIQTEIATLPKFDEVVMQKYQVNEKLEQIKTFQTELMSSIGAIMTKIMFKNTATNIPNNGVDFDAIFDKKRDLVEMITSNEEETHI